MRLLTVGDSFTYGEELDNLTNAWPNLLADKLGYKLTNLAKPGSGNTRMIRLCIEQVDNYDIVVIAWSHWARIEFADNYGIYDTWPGHQGLTFTGNIDFRNQLLQYITHNHNDDYLYNQQLINVILLQNYLKSVNKKYIMITSFGKLISKPNQELIRQIDNTYYPGWPNETMMEWTYGTAQGPNGHFLEAGHQRVADKINEHIRNLGWVS